MQNNHPVADQSKASTRLERVQLPRSFDSSDNAALESLAAITWQGERVCYGDTGLLRLLDAERVYELAQNLKSDLFQDKIGFIGD